MEKRLELKYVFILAVVLQVNSCSVSLVLRTE